MIEGLRLVITELSLSETLGRTSIYHIYREEATSVSLEFTFFKGKQNCF